MASGCVQLAVFVQLLILLVCCFKYTAGCGGCSTCANTDPACVPTQVRTRRQAYRNGWWWNVRTEYHVTYEYYKGTPYCCPGYSLDGMTCTINERTCGGCDGDDVVNQPACSEEVQQKQSHVASIAFTCNGWWFTTRTCYRQHTYYQLARFVIRTCCAGYTLVGTNCIKDTAPKVCGISKYPNPGVRLTYVVGGLAARPNEFPWQLRLTMKGSGMCGAVLLDQEWALTAAHCVLPYTDTPTQIGVVAGDHRYKTWDSTEQVRFGGAIFVHPDYKKRTFANDLALVRFRQPLSLSDNIQPICLPENCDEVYTNETAYIIGWGRASAGPRKESVIRHNELQFASMVVKQKSFCNVFSGSFETFLCISDGQDDVTSGPCFGDSGGPLVIKGPDGKFKVVGIASFVAMTGCAAGLPSGFTDLRLYLRWIKQLVH